MFARNNPYHNARMINASNVVMGGVNRQISSVDDYLHLRQDNNRLNEEVATLRSELSHYQGVMDSTSSLSIDSRFHVSPLEYKVARVVRNTITKRDNYLTINRGTDDGITPDMALVNDYGILGYILDCSKNYSVAVSILNMNDFRTSGKIKGSEFTGSISWDGIDYRYVELTEIPKYAEIAQGDTVVTTEYSNIFPAELPIGTVENFELVNATFYKVKLKLFADMSSMRYVYVVKLEDQAQRRELENRRR